MTLLDLATVAAHLVVAAGVGWMIAGLGLAWIGRSGLRDFGSPERALLSLLGFVGFTLLLMLMHLVTGGAIFGTTYAVPVACVALGVVAWRRRPMPPRLPLPAVFIGLVLVLLYVVPIFAAGSALRVGDPPWHLGWTEQLLAGEAVPTGPAAEVGRNAYPWGFHALMATLVRAVPGSDPLVALEAIHVLVVVALPLAAAVLARRVVADAGMAAAAAMSLVGGWGWVARGEAIFSATPRAPQHGADLVVASPNSVYELLAPGSPRELALVLLAAGTAALLAERARPDPRLGVVAGMSFGCAGLVNVPLFLTALVWLLAVAVGVPSARAAVLRAAAVAGALFSLWAGPVITDYLRYGGFVSITPRLGKEWPLYLAFSSWGILLPLAMLGAWRLRRGLRAADHAFVTLCVATLVLLGLAKARGYFGWTLAGNATLLHQGRVWPALHLLGAVLAGIGLLWIYRGLIRRGRLVALAAATGLLVIGAVSPVVAGIQLGDVVREGRNGFVYSQPHVRAGSFVRRAAALLDPADVVAGHGPHGHEIAFLLFQFSGTRLAAYDDPLLDRNDLRIRYRDLAARWNARSADGVTARATHQVAPSASSAAPSTTGRALVTGTYKGISYTLYATGD